MATLELAQLAALLQPLAAQPLEAAATSSAAGDGAPALQLSAEQARLISEAFAQAVAGQAVGQAAQEAAPQPAAATEAGAEPQVPVVDTGTDTGAAEAAEGSGEDDQAMEAETVPEQVGASSQEVSVPAASQPNQGFVAALDCFQRYAELFHKACSEAQASAITMPQVHVSMRLHDPAPAGTVGLAWCSEPARLRVPDIFTAGDIMALACIQAGGSLVPQAVFRKALRKEVDAATESLPALQNAQRDFKVRMRDADPLSMVLDLAKEGGDGSAALGSPEKPLELWVAVQPHGFGCLRTACGYVLKSANAGIRTSGVRGTRMNVRPPPSLMTSPSARRSSAPTPTPRPPPPVATIPQSLPGTSAASARPSATPPTTLQMTPSAAALAAAGLNITMDAAALAAAAVAAAAALGIPPAPPPAPIVPPPAQAAPAEIANLGHEPISYPPPSEVAAVAAAAPVSGQEHNAGTGGDDDSEETEDEAEPARKKARPTASNQGAAQPETGGPAQAEAGEGSREASPQPAGARPARRAKTNRRRVEGSEQPESGDEGTYAVVAQPQAAQPTTGPSPGGGGGGGGGGRGAGEEAADVDAAQALLSVREGRHPARMPGERRARVKYSDEEIHAILDGLLALSEQQRETAWATIKKNAGAVLAKRSNVDLKDKWRNLQLQWYKNELTPELAAKVQRVKAKTDHPGPWPEGMQW